jgi:hypothetical protein
VLGRGSKGSLWTVERNLRATTFNTHRDVRARCYISARTFFIHPFVRSIPFRVLLLFLWLVHAQPLSLHT